MSSDLHTYCASQTSLLYSSDKVVVNVKQLNIIISIQSLQILPEIGPGPARRKKIMFFDLSIPPDKLQDSLNI